MDTDSNYIAISAEQIEDIVRPELKPELEAQKKHSLALDKWSGRTPGLFKLECVGSRIIALCSKCYFIDDPEGEKMKFSTKGMSKKQNKGGWLFFPLPNRPPIRCRWLCRNIFFFDGNGGFLAGKACYLVVQSGHNFRKPFYPRRGPLALGQVHFNGVLVPELTHRQGAVETFNNGLVTVNVNSPVTNVRFVIFHFFCNSAPEFAPRVNLQQLRLFQRRALVNYLKSHGNFIRIYRGQGFNLFVAAGHIDNDEGIFENFASTGQFVVRQKKKFRLVDCVGCWHVKFRPRNALRRGEEYLPEGLLDQTLFCGFFWYLGGLG